MCFPLLHGNRVLIWNAKHSPASCPGTPGAALPCAVSILGELVEATEPMGTVTVAVIVLLSGDLVSLLLYCCFVRLRHCHAIDKADLPDRPPAQPAGRVVIPPDHDGVVHSMERRRCLRAASMRSWSSGGGTSDHSSHNLLTS